jgi:hypothetical protein
MSSHRMEPPPSADPGPDVDRALREIQASKPTFGCLGRTTSGCSALLAMGGLLVAIVYLVGRRGR